MIVAMLVHVMFAIGMDKALISNNFHGIVKKTALFKSPVLDCDNFDHLVMNNADYLRSLVREEEAGRYCSALHRAISVLRKNSQQILDKKALKKRCDDKSVVFIKLISERDNDLQIFIDSLERGSEEAAKSVLRHNKYVANAYSLQIDYGGIAAPLHYILRLYRQNTYCKTFNCGIKYLLQSGANVNGIDCDGNAPLHLVSTTKQAKRLLDKGACCNQKNNKGLTPLMKLILGDQNKYNNLVSLLIDQGVDFTLADDVGNTILAHALIEQKIFFISALLFYWKQQVLHNDQCLFDFPCLFDISNTSGVTISEFAYHSNKKIRNLVQRYMCDYCGVLLLHNKVCMVKDFLSRHPWIHFY